MFNEYEFKDITTRIKVQFTRKDNIVPRPWEVSNFINSYSSYYYKIEILNTISIALNYGILPQNIFILDASFKLNKSYSKLNMINLTNVSLKDLYSIGKPISLFPNEDIYVINLFFEFFFAINQKLYQYHSKRISRKNLFHYYDKILVSGVKLGFKAIINDAKKNLENVTEKAWKSFDKTYEDYNHEYEKYLKNSITFSVINRELLEDTNEIDEDYSEDIIKYYFQFFKSFNNLSRPVVGIYYPGEKTMQILCKEHIIYGQSEIRDAKFLDVKEISHNSPLRAIFEGGISVVKTLKEEKRQEELHELELKKKELELRELETRVETAELQKLGVIIDNYKKLSDIGNSPELLAAKQINNTYLRKQIEHNYNKMAQNATNLLKSNKFDVEYEKVTTIDIRV